VVFTGNLFGPLFMCVPNFNTLRGDKMRSIGRFLESLEIVRGLGAELLITGHGEPIRGGAEIAAKLNRLRDGVRYIHDQTIAGMNAGKDVHTLMREIRLPPELALEESYGNVIWAVRTIWLEYTGWFHFDGTTDLYDVPVGSVAPDLLQLAGGSRKIAARAAQYVSEGQPLQALHLIELTVPAAPSDRALLEVKIDAQKALLARQDGNFHSTMWLKADIAEVEKQLAMKSQEMHDHQARKA
jgi:alkyl sulfatase BDS1-like metallo-beta-lactamase superfamily hydrolase